MTRQEYLIENTRDGAHREYYGQFVDQSTINRVCRSIGKGRIKASTDPHFNDIPLGTWDRLGINSTTLQAKMKALGDYPTAAGLVCIAKEAARQIAETPKPQQAPPRQQ